MIGGPHESWPRNLRVHGPSSSSKWRHNSSPVCRENPNMRRRGILLMTSKLDWKVTVLPLSGTSRATTTTSALMAAASTMSELMASAGLMLPRRPRQPRTRLTGGGVATSRSPTGECETHLISLRSGSSAISWRPVLTNMPSRSPTVNIASWPFSRRSKPGAVMRSRQYAVGVPTGSAIGVAPDRPPPTAAKRSVVGSKADNASPLPVGRRSAACAAFAVRGSIKTSAQASRCTTRFSSADAIGAASRADR